MRPNADNFEREFWGIIFGGMGWAEALEKQGRNIRGKNSLLQTHIKNLTQI